jgi:two-component sensor histidine kinase
MTLSVADNGVGLPEEVGFGSTQTLGLRLVGTLVRQIEGSVRVDRAEGTAVHITFSVGSLEAGCNHGVGAYHGRRR